MKKRTQPADTEILFRGEIGTVYTENDYQKYLQLSRYAQGVQMNREEWFEAMEAERSKGMETYRLSVPKKNKI